MLSINTNLSSLITQNSLKNSTSILNQAVERMTTGYKINHAKDNAANYSIATNMTTKIGSYMVAEDNVLQGLDMVNTASENLSLIDDKLNRLRALAVQSTNGTYGEQSLKAINAEANALVDEINRTYATAEYNGIKTFKGTAKLENPDGVGTTGNVGVQPAATYSMRATNYGDFLADPYTYEQSYVDSLSAVSEVVQADGFTESEYKIATVDDLVKLAELTNAGIDTSGVTFILANDLDIGAYCDAEIAAGKGGWTPIGNNTNDFKGTFDGNGHVIKNLKIERNEGYQGLFGKTYSGSEIKNIGLEGGIIAASGKIGGLVGDSFSTISNCYATVDIEGTSGYLGCLVGYSRSSISNSYATGNVTGTNAYSAGGYVGGLAGAISSSSTTSNCYATGDVSGYSYIGGLVGDTYCANIINCYATGTVVSGNLYAGGLTGRAYNSTISNCYATGVVNGSRTVGGLVGTSSSTISNSYATGNVTGTTDVGGLVGNSSSSSLPTISNSYATGDVTGSSYVGGFVGDSSNTTISNCYAIGVTTGSSDIGGFVGRNDSSTVINSASVQADTYATVMTVEQIKSTYTPDLMGFTEANGWTIINDVPLLSWQREARQATPTPGGTSGVNVNLQVGVNSSNSSQIVFELGFSLVGVDDLKMIGLDTTTDFIGIVDDLLSIVSEKQTLYGAVQNRLMSVLDEITIQRENLVSSRSTIRDADIAEVSSHYIQQQILQQASSTLLATANQSPAIALQLI